MKKRRVRLLTLLLLSVVTAACGSGTNESASGSPSGAGASAPMPDPVEIEFWNIWGGELIDALVKEYNSSQSKVKVNAVYVQNGYEGIVEKLQVQAAAKKLPDVVSNGLLYTRFANDVMRAVPLDPFIKRDGYDISDFFPTMLNLGKNEQGQQIGMPYGISTPILYYNADQFKAAGLDPDKPPQTWEEFTQVAKQLTRDGRYGASVPIDFGWLYQAVMQTYGGSMMSADGKMVGLDSEASVNAVQTIVDMVNKDKSMPLLQQIQTFDAMAKGNVSMLVNTTAGISMIKPTAKFELRTAPFPTYGGKRVVPAGGANLMLFSADKAKQEAAWDFIKFMIDPKQSVKISTSTGYMVSRKKALDDPDMQKFLTDNPVYKATYEQVDVMVPWFNFPGTGGTRVQKIISDQIQAALQGQKTPKDAMKEAAKQANALIQS
ncbi:ABC transporter substrate-binding protein [Paenibacillus sp. GYB003]|uniref:ABC transporter substrate-binding protein n=1 Tax=Paenibacillus sp. GYB003 TaxID=2994392 RepID=UPI002F9627F9